MNSRKIWVASSAVVGLAAGGLLMASPAMAAQKTCTITSQSTLKCVTGTLPANSSSHSITICASYYATSYAYDKVTDKRVGSVSSSSPLHCTDIGGLYGTSYYVIALGNVNGKGYISN
jgi:hypothetical protein